MNKIIATANFKVSGTTSYGCECKGLNVKMELEPSGAFQYGNQTMVTMTIKEEGKRDRKEYFDTRYERHLRSDGKNFAEWAFEAVKGYFDKNLTIEQV